MIAEFEKQPQSRLRELGLLEPEHPKVLDNKYYNKSKSKLDKFVKGGYKVIDENIWIETDIKKYEERYDADIRIDTWLKSTEQNAQHKIYEILARSLEVKILCIYERSTRNNRIIE